MAVPPSTMLALGTDAPTFALLDTRDETTVRLQDLDKRKGLLVMFLSNHCPYVKHLKVSLAAFAREYMNIKWAPGKAPEYALIDAPLGWRS